MNLKELETKVTKIIGDFGKEPRIFKSEAQFQFDLAWELKASFDDEEKKEYKVFLEYLGDIKKNETDEDKKKRLFTDIMIIGNDGAFFPIELKYKTKELDVSKDFVHLADHGACDLGRFDFLYDVERIQKFKKKDPNYDFDPKLKTFAGGIAIMLTNDEHYWKYTKAFVNGRKRVDWLHPLYEEFCIGEGEIIKPNTKLNWKNGGIGTCVEDTDRKDEAPLIFDKEHRCKWDHYCTYEGVEFKYLVFDVDQ
jgi:hypothetical protein